MPQVTTAYDLIVRSLRLINVIGAGEVPEEADLNDGLITLNEMLDSWGLQTLASFQSPNTVFTLTPGKATYKWGTGAGLGEFDSPRPISVDSAFCTRNGVDTPVLVITQDEYDAISLKATSQELIERVLYVNSFPFGLLTCYPVPSSAVTLSFSTQTDFPTLPTLQTQLAMPAGYQRAIRYNLAVELWPEYSNPVVDINSIRAAAKESFGKVKVANIEPVPMVFDDVPSVDSRDYDWRIG